LDEVRLAGKIKNEVCPTNRSFRGGRVRKLSSSKTPRVKKPKKVAHPACCDVGLHICVGGRIQQESKISQNLKREHGRGGKISRENHGTTGEKSRSLKKRRMHSPSRFVYFGVQRDKETKSLTTKKGKREVLEERGGSQNKNQVNAVWD